MSDPSLLPFGSIYAPLRPDQARDPYQISLRYELLLNGKINSTGRFQLPSGNSVDVEHPNIHTQCVILLSPEDKGIDIAATNYGDKTATIEWNGSHPGVWVRYVILG